MSNRAKLHARAPINLDSQTLAGLAFATCDLARVRLAKNLVFHELLQGADLVCHTGNVA